MLLEDATSAEQVEAALKAGDEELRQDIEDILDEAKRRWENSGYGYNDDYEPVDMKEIVERPDFVDDVIATSPSQYDLSQVPRENIEAQLYYDARHPSRYGRSGNTTYGPFYIDDRGGAHFSYKFEVGGNYTFRGALFPEKAEFIPSGIARDFWNSLGDYEWEQTSSVSRWDDNYGSGRGTDVYVEASTNMFNEWCRDLVSEYIRESVKKDPAKAKALFLKAVADEDRELGKKLADANLPNDELLSFASAWFEDEGGREETLESLREYFDALEAGVDEPREVIAEFSKQDIAAMGIKKGTLFENAPWKLIKLIPADLRLEGTLMGHCVGKSEMGYVRAVRDGEIEIWSLRSPANKPRFTLEVDASFYRADDDDGPKHGTKMQTLTPAFYRAKAIKQLKGKANRTPGYADMRGTGGIKFPDEVIFWDHALRALDVAPEEVSDFDALRDTEEPIKLQANDGETCGGFDIPYRRGIDLAQNRRRSSKRRSSKRKSSKRRTSRRRSSRI